MKSTRTPGVRPSIQRLIDAITGAPALIRNTYFDYVAANPLARALYSPVFDQPDPNSARFTFLNPQAREFYSNWDQPARSSSPPCAGSPAGIRTTSD